MLKINNVSKKFDNTVVLNDINLDIEKGSIIGLAGLSGSGKSTLLRCIQGLDSQDTGTIECNGKVGFMFQDFQLFPHITVLDNLSYAPSIKDKETNYKDKAQELLAELGIADKYSSYPHELSGGQKQRVALARSLMMHPCCLLCDEPTSGLDVATISDVVNLLFKVKAMGVTMLIASHDLDFLSKVADRVVVLKQGEIKLDVKPASLDDPIAVLKEHY